MVRTRFAPSPTGVLHIGSVRTALFCWLYARRHNGKFILRIEDTDLERSTQENVDAILDSMNWLGLDADEDPIFQTDRFDRYHEIANQLFESGKAYRCYSTKEELEALREEQKKKGQKTRYDGRYRDVPPKENNDNYVLRFKNPLDGIVIVEDAVKGKVEFKNDELDDLIILRSDGTPTYNFTVVVDDIDMNISHVIRGDDHLNNTPRQINIYEALGAKPPTFAHIPMTLGEDGSKLSKRHGAMDIREYREKGYLPTALLNYMARLGWSHGDQEVFTVDEMISLFDIRGINKASSTFSSDKLLWLNHQHINKLNYDEIIPLLKYHMTVLEIDYESGPDLKEIIDVYSERSETVLDMAKSSIYCFQDIDDYDDKAVKKHLRPVILDPLNDVKSEFEKINNWKKENIDSAIEKIVNRYEINMGKLGQPLRVAVTGSSMSPSINKTLALIGKNRSIERINKAIEIIKKRIESNKE